MCAQRLSFKCLGAVILVAAGLTTTPALAAWPFSSKPTTPPAANPPATAPSSKAQAQGFRKATPAERAAAERMEPLARATFWEREFRADPTDAEAGVNLSSALRAMARYEEAIQAAEQVLVTSPRSVPALLETARGLIGAGRPFYAIDPLKQAQTLSPKDWRPLSYLGLVYEQTERSDEALVAYKQAVALSPDNPAVMSNLALFYAGHGDAAQAETLLRRAAAMPNSTVQERQNLALLLGLQGKLAEAERLMRQDLPPEVVANNLNYFKTSASVAPPPANAARTWRTLEGVQDGQAARKP